MKLRVITLIENSLGPNDCLVCEHGLSLQLEVNQHRILFDTGSTGEFINNAKKLKIDLNQIDYVILSHGHDDHTGGYKEFHELYSKNYQLVVGKGFFSAKYKKTDEGYIYDGNPFDEDFLYEVSTLQVGDKVTKLSDDIYVLSQFSKLNDFEVVKTRYYLKEDQCYIQDEFKEEVALVIKSDKGLIIFLGCSHIGIVNILESIKEKMKKPIYGVFGGAHLIREDTERIAKTVDYFNEQNIKIVGLSHCTGDPAVMHIRNHFKGKYIPLNTGIELNIGELDG